MFFNLCLFLASIDKSVLKFLRCNIHNIGTLPSGQMDTKIKKKINTQRFGTFWMRFHNQCTICKQTKTFQNKLFIYYWWIVRDTLVVAFGFLPQNFKRWQEPMNGILSSYECSVVGTLKPYLMQKNLFELFALTGADRKILGMNASTRHERSCLGHQVKFPDPNCHNIAWADQWFVINTGKYIWSHSSHEMHCKKMCCLQNNCFAP